MAILTPEQQQMFARQRLGLQSNADQDKRRLDEDFASSSRQLLQSRDRNVRDVGDQIAGNGLSNSGIRITEQGNVVREYNDSLSDLTQQRTRSSEDIDRGLATGIADIDANAASALAEANRREQEDNDRRAMLEAQAQAAMAAPPAYPNPVIAMPAPQPLPTGGSLGNDWTRRHTPSPPWGGRDVSQPVSVLGVSGDWNEFVSRNPDQSQKLMTKFQGNPFAAMQYATDQGWIRQQQARPSSRGRWI